MFTPYVDLHTHTSLSDGIYTPQQVIDRARKNGICILALTDHDTTSNLSALRQANPDMQLIQGAEFSCSYISDDGKNHELHVIGLGFDPEHPKIKSVIQHNHQDRRPYINAMLFRLRELGIEIGTYEDLKKRFPDTKQLGRMQIAKAMTEKKYTASVDEAFDEYIGAFGARKTFVENPLRHAPFEMVVQAILEAGGIPVLCHLLYYRMYDAENRQLVQRFKELAGDKAAMEVYYNRYTSPQRLELLKLAQENGLLISAASDFHGQAEWEQLSNYSYSVCSALLDRLGIEIPNAVPASPILVLSGFSGAGKGTVVEKLCKDCRTANGKQIDIVVSVTTRKRRNPDDNYIFLTQEEFEKMAVSGQLLEYNDAYSGNRYGTPISGVQQAINAGALPCLEIDRNGLKQLLSEGRIDPLLIRSVFVAATATELNQRLHMRNTESEPVIRQRLLTALDELEDLHLYNAVVVNEENSLEETVEKVLQAFQGNPHSDEFDPVKFKMEMEAILRSEPT